jgi:branched-chain amino acid transport system permease protein
VNWVEQQQILHVGVLLQGRCDKRLPLAILVLALATYALLHRFMTHTRFGRIVRATVDDPEVSALMGVDTRRVYAVGMALSMAIVALAGWLFGIKSSFSPMTGGDQLLFSFEAVIIGGMGSIWGTLLGGMALGIAQVVGLHIHAGWGAFAGHLVFFAFCSSTQRSAGQGASHA